MSYSGKEVWAGDYHGLLHTFSMNEGSFKSIAQFNVGHSSLVTGIHHSPGTLYTCSSDRTIKVKCGKDLNKNMPIDISALTCESVLSVIVHSVFCVFASELIVWLSGLLQVHLPCAPPKTLCTLHNKAVVNGVSGAASFHSVARLKPFYIQCQSKVWT